MKVLVVDDELPIREWLKMAFSRLEKEPEQVITAGNGKEAWDLFREEKPELVVTDIKMPRMDGLELLQKIKTEAPETYVVMLTSYEEFEYARKAIQYQANEYVLKNEITSQLLSRILEKFRQHKGENGFAGETVSICEMLESGSIAPKLLEERPGEWLFAAAFVRGEEERESIEPYLNSFVTGIDVYPYDEKVAVWICHGREIPSTGLSFHEAMAFCQELSQLKEREIGFSGFWKKPLEASLRARKALNLHFYENRTGVYSYGGEGEQDLPELKRIRKQVVGLIRQGRGTEAKERIRELMAELERRKPLDLEAVVHCFWDIIDAYKVANLEFAGRELEEVCRETKKKIQEAKLLEELKRVVREFLQELEGAMLIQEKPYSSYVKEALAYVANHYGAMEGLTEISGYIGLNPEYFCRLFKAEVGMTFNGYLTDYRVRKAVELLTGTDMKVYEVAEKVGYSNLSYFSRVFKKVTGMNPFFYKTDKISKKD